MSVFCGSEGCDLTRTHTKMLYSPVFGEHVYSLQNTVIFIKHPHTFHMEPIRSPVVTQDCKPIIFIKESMVFAVIELP